MQHIHGTCHCGNVTFDLTMPERDGPIPVRACGCTFCRKHGGVYTSHPQGSLRARVEDPARLERYRFGTATADFYVCARCGVVPFVTSTVDERTYAVVNVNTFEGIADRDLDASPTDFDGEDIGSRLARRTRSWIPDVSVTLAGE